MNRGLIMKAFRELWPTTVMVGAGLLLVEMLLAYVLPTFAEQFSAQWLQMKFIQNIMKAMTGTDAAGSVGPEIFTSLPWVHPVALALMWTHAIICCTRVPVGEVDRGTIDVLLGLPVSRWELFLSDTAVWMCSAIVLFLLALIGNILGSLSVQPQMRPSLPRLLIVLTNLFCLYLSVGGIAWLMSALSERRGRAITAVLVMVLASFLLNYVAQFWAPADRLAFLSIMRYHRPLFVIRDGTWPLSDMAVLTAIAVATWLAAGVVFARRDLSTL